MTTHSETRALPYTPEQMYDLVADVPSYPEFLPWCSAARERTRLDEGDRIVVEVDLVISFKVFRERFGSRVTLWPKRKIETEYIDGPFSHMHSIWEFAEAEGGGCEVKFFVDFEFRNKVLGAAAGVFFNDAMQRIVRAFERRAAQLYG
ncbi:MAG: type II toxin-antitoxin system RatA family toxin [Paracoccaceae bacterium]|nr:type II toxin-antitoxin system RatA family toxin [Paracoccaceae bacterium]